MIRAHAISKQYGNLRAVDELDLDVPEGAVCGLLGPNGAGKTTTIRMLTGILPPDSGTLEVAGYPMPEERGKALARLGYLPESAPSSPEMRVIEYLRFRGSLLSLDRRTIETTARSAMDACGIEDVSRRLIGTLSKGYRQRVGLAAAMVGNPKLLILDEPTVGLDPRQLLEFRALLRNLAHTRTIVISSHIMQEIEAVCDQIVVLHQGRTLASGTQLELQETVGAHARLMGEAAGSMENIKAAVQQAAPGIEVDFKTLSDGVIRFEFDTNHDPRAVVGAAVADCGGVIRSLERKEPGLEELFLKLLDDADTGGDV